MLIQIKAEHRQSEVVAIDEVAQKLLLALDSIGIDAKVVIDEGEEYTL